MIGALVLSGGDGTRLANIGIQKQYYKISGVPIIIRTLVAFQECIDIETIVIVAQPIWYRQIGLWLDKHKIFKFSNFASAGHTRQHSIYNGLLKLEQYSIKHVIVHDAVRPFVTVNDIKSCINAAIGYDGATPVLCINDTVYNSKDGRHIDSLLNRDELFAGQTPEIYDYTLYLDANKNYLDKDHSYIHGSSEMAFKSGMSIRLYNGNENNFKITTASDLKYAEYLLKGSQSESMGTT